MRRYHVTTFGCQMNAHDSERIKGMLEELGLGEAPTQEQADVLVFNTCTIREKPDTKLAAYLGDAGARKRRDPDLVVAVGGCYAEAQRERIFELYPQVDVAFGPGSIPHLGDWIGANGEAPRGRFGTHEHFAGDLPMHRERRHSAWVQVSMGCNSKCAYCIVPAVRGREQSRRPGEIVAEVTRLAGDGVREITLLGQNVNSWGRDLRPGLDTEFGELLRACDAVDGIERIRFTSPHPKDFRDPVIAAMAECDAVCEHVHLPLQSGSSRILKAMRRTYDRERYLRLVAKLRDAIPGLALGTDVIVGFPGETEDDFRATLEVVEQVRYDSAFTFIYSPRRGTEAADMADQVPEEVKHERLERLVEVVQRIAAERNAERVGTVQEVLVEGASRTDSSLLRGRTRTNVTVNFAGDAQAGELVDVLVDGQIGTNLALRLLSEGHEVFGVDQRVNTWTDEFRYLLQDLSGQYPAFPDGIGGVPYPETDVVVHLAAHAKVHQLVAQPHRALENAMMTFNVLEYCRQRRLPLVFSSTREVYGDVHRFEGYGEESADFAFTESPYSASKIASEAFIYAYARCYGLRYLAFRFSNVYGRYDNDLQRMSRVLPLFMHQMSRGEAITVYGGADKVLDFTYIDDCVEGIARGVESLVDGRVSNETINLAFGEGNTLVRAAELIAAELDVEPQMTIAPSLLGEVTRYVADIRKARDLLGWEPQVPLAEGIPRAVSWFREHRAAHPEEDQPVANEGDSVGWKTPAAQPV
jgi:tRNA-2-methylthio-N6-dimethylallyladenosine synthase